jgi:PAS domain S-box-containing protein
MNPPSSDPVALLEVELRREVLLRANLIAAGILLLGTLVGDVMVHWAPLTVLIQGVMILLLLTGSALARAGRIGIATHLSFIVLVAGLSAPAFYGYTDDPLLDLTLIATTLQPVVILSCLVGESRYQPLIAALIAIVIALAIVIAAAWRGLLTHHGEWGMVLVYVLPALAASGIAGWLALTIRHRLLSLARDEARKLGEHAQRLARAEDRLRVIIDSVNDAVLVLDPASGAILEANHRAEEMYGGTAAEIIGIGADLDRISEGVAPYSRVEAMTWLTRTRTEGPQVITWHIRRRDGTLFWGEVATRFTRIAGEERILLTVRDITERLRMEERLRQGEKLEAIGQLAGGVAHDFNNQLTGILGNAELLAKALDEPRLRRFAENIAVAAGRASDLTRQLLAFARKGRYLVVAVDLHRLLEEVVALLSRTLDPRIVIRQERRARHAFVTGDPSQLENALLNLALNARDAMPEGGELTFATDEVTVETGDERVRHGELAAGTHLRLRVTDTGTGMEPAVLARLFEPFFTTKEPGQGTGMGLASIYGTVRHHHGIITVTSKPGSGSTFTVLLPLTTPGPVGEPTPPATPLSRPLRILLVEDESLVREVAEGMLREFGHEVMACADGEAAVASYRASWRELDLVILDMVMPRLNGRDVFRQMRSINPQARILLCSGYSLEREARDLLDAGAVGFLQKPYRMKELARALAEAFAPPGTSSRLGLRIPPGAGP